MEGAGLDAPRTGSAVAVALLGLAASVAGAALYGDAAPYVGFLDLARTALPGVALAGAALVVAFLGSGGPAVLVLSGAAVASAAPGLAVGLEQRSAAWVAVGALAHLLAPAVVALALLFASGRLESTSRRVTAAAVGLVGLAAAVVQALTYDPGGWGWCRCVGNPLAGVSGPSGYPHVGDALLVTQLVVALAGLVVFAAGPTWRRRGVPVAFGATFALLVLCWAVADVAGLRSVDGAPGWVEVLQDVTLALLPALYVVGYAAQLPSRAHVADLLLAAREGHDPERLQTLVGRAIGDPQAMVAWWDPALEEFRSHDGRAAALPDHGVLRVEAEGRPIALVTAERLDAVDAGVRDSVAEALLLAAENRRLTAELRASLEQVRDSRARIVAAEDETKRRIERDLHDGAQQLLISTGIKLNLAANRAGARDPALAGVLDEASAELNKALAELRSLASGIAPTSLVHGSLDNALRELAMRSAVPTTVRVTGDGEPDDAVASTVYFVVAECLANVAKHADAEHAVVEVTLGSPVRVGVRDDGHGGATLAGRGTGLRGLVDRVESRGGRLELVSGSSGTTVTATVPSDGADR
jgi:signal transduction histidine kinase